jgi:diguanylate cyclase (GGDEF)-like protein/PAS domain S-box-containing protein
MALQTSPKVVLVVEDDAEIQVLETELMGDHGHQVIHAVDGKSALDWLAGHRPDLMLLDYSLPDMTGIELLDQLTAAGIGIPPFIVTTGAGDEYVAVDLMRRGAQHYLVKDHDFLKQLPVAIERALHDIEMAQRLAVAEARLRLAAQIIEGTNEGILVTDAVGVVIEVNPAFEAITGHGREDVVNQPFEMLLPGHASDTALVAAVVQALQSVGHWQGEVQCRRKSGEIFTAWINVGRIASKAGEAVRYVALFSDISSVKVSAERLDYLAHHDPLTGLPNRLLFNTRLHHSIERAKRAKCSLGVLFLDLDHFKEVNDRLSHSAGDDLLCLLAKRMKDVLREEDTLARLGGDEFVILLEAAGSAHDLRRVSDVLLALFPYRVETPKGVVNVTISIGGALYPHDAATKEDLVACADKAMYAAKVAGRNTFVMHGT